MKKVLLLLVILGFSFAPIAEEIDTLAEQHVRLALQLGEHDKAYVDAYMGPKEWREHAKNNTKPLATIINEAENLVKNIGLLPPSSDALIKLRQHYLLTQTKAMVTKAKMVAGTIDLTFDEEINQLFDTQAPHNKLKDFEPVLAELDKLLPGEGSLQQRAEEFDKQFHIPADKLSAVMDASIAECKARTLPMVKLMENERFTVKYVKDKPYGGYNWYMGDAYSVIDVNTDLPSLITYALKLGCHEGYPGHHVFNLLHEQIFVNQNNWVEFYVFPLFGPLALLAEGSANYGVTMAFPDKEKLEFEKQVLYPLAGIDPSLAESRTQVDELLKKLNYAGNEIYRLYFNKQITNEKAIALFMKYGLKTKEQAQQSIRFGETYGAYVINYNWGMDLVKAFIEQGNKTSQEQKWKRFIQLLTEPRVPSSLDW